jgi:hypothetical protein
MAQRPIDRQRGDGHSGQRRLIATIEASNREPVRCQAADPDSCGKTRHPYVIAIDADVLRLDGSAAIRETREFEDFNTDAIA